MLKDRALWGMALGQTLVWANLYYIFPAMLVVWEQGLGWSKAQITSAFALAVLASAAAAPLAGRIIDRGYGAAVMGASAFLGGLALASLAWVETLGAFRLVWLGIGVTLAGCLYEPCFAIVTRARGPMARQAITRITLVAGFAGSLGFPMAHLLSEAIGWRMAVLALGGLTSCFVAPLLAVSAVGFGAGPKPQPRASLASGRLQRNRVFWAIGAAFALIGLVHGATLSHLLPLLDEREVSATIAVAAAASIGPMQVVGRLAMVSVERWASPTQILTVAYGAIGMAMVIFWGAGDGLPALWLGIVLFGGAYGTISILRPVLIRSFLGDRAFGATSGELATLYLTAVALAPFWGAVAWDLVGYDGMLLVLGLLSVVAYLAFRLAQSAADVSR